MGALAVSKVIWGSLYPMTRHFGSLTVGSKICKARCHPMGEQPVQPEGALNRLGHQIQWTQTIISIDCTEIPGCYHMGVPGVHRHEAEQNFQSGCQDVDKEVKLGGACAVF